MICANCQQEASPGDRFCINCGALLVEEPPEDAAYPGEEQTPAGMYAR